MSRLLSLILFVIAVPRTTNAASPSVTLEEARRILPTAADCNSVPCLLERAYGSDSRAASRALQLWNEGQHVAGVGPDELLDGGFRGTIHLVPQLPLAEHRQHLDWVATGMHDTDRFFAQLFANRAPPPYRWQAVQFRFVRSLVKRRPSAYAFGWTIEYNVRGSLNTNAKAVSETLFHELFHLNDEAHGDWSAKHLQADYRGVLKKCGVKPKLACLAPYAPNDTLVRGGTYYAFQQNNGDAVHEYAAELAVRYLKEQSQMLANGKLTRRAFKCGPAVNGRAWSALVSEFFDGRDLVPAC